MSFADACLAGRRIGYGGIEIEPAHLDSDPVSLSPARRREVRDTILRSGLGYAGLHNILKTPGGLHLTTPDAALRARSWEYLGRLVDLAADLGPRPVMVLGSSRQRATTGGATRTGATHRLAEGLGSLAAHLRSRGVTILVEPLAPHLCDVVNTLEEAMRIVAAVSSPAVQTMFDTHNTAAETLPLAGLLRKYHRHIRHVHLNEMDGRYPGAGDFPFRTVLDTLAALNYRGWLSVEVFDFKPDGETVARRALDYLTGRS